MTDDLRQGARDALIDFGTVENAPAFDASVEHASLDVRVGASHETVSLRMRDGRLRSACTCGDNACEHLRVALRFVAGEIAEPVLELPARSMRPWASRPSLHPDPRRVQHDAPQATPSDTSLAEVLEDIVTAVERAGGATQNSVPVQDALERLLELVRGAMPLGISRFVGRLRPALEAADASTYGPLLRGASMLASDLRSDMQTEDARARKLVWLGVAGNEGRNVERLIDRTLLEVAREWVHGHERFGIERRYFADVSAGEVYCEERLRRGHAASVGPCPRLIGVGLAEAERAGVPRRVRLMQYTVSIQVPLETWRQLGFWAQRDFGALSRSFAAASERFAGFSEPLAIVAPAGVMRATPLTLLDEAGHELPLYAEDDDGTLARATELAHQASPTWIVGRLLQRDERLVLRPLSIGILKDDRMRYERL